MGNKIDLTGRRFGRLVVGKEIGRNREGKVTWECLCDCGSIVVRPNRYLLSGDTMSCGCLRRDMVAEKNGKHGHSTHRLHRVWTNMKQRCCNQNNTSFKDYGGRGILFCDEWLDFKVFYDWAMSSGYQKGLTIERKDNNGNYCPQNCTWIPLVDQAKNRRPKKNTRFISSGGVTKSVIEWANHLGIAADTLLRRIYKGWSEEDTINQPLRIRRQHNV